MILGMVPKSKFFYSYLVTGGGSMQTNLKPYLKNKFGIEVEIFDPSKLKEYQPFGITLQLCHFLL